MLDAYKEKFHRDIGLFGLTMVGIGSIIGSGWLFGSYFAAQLAGPAAILCWIIGGLACTIIALTISELGSAFPKAGGMVRYMEYSHGSLASFMSGWANWLGIVASIPSEAEASIQYMSSWKWQWAQNLYNPTTHNLTHTGIIGAVILVLFYFAVNYWSLKLFVRFVSSITIFKIIVPLLTAIAILYAGFHPSNFTSVGNTFIPYGWANILTAVVTCGIIFSFNGFQSPVNLAGEAKRPSINVPLAIILGILSTLLIYLLLQVAFIGAVSPAQLAQAGWRGLQFHSPLAELALIFQLNFIALLLYIDSFVSPSGTGIIYMGTATRMLYGMERNKYMPSFLGFLHPKYRIPRLALITNLIISFIFMYFFSGWAHIVAIVSIANVVAFIPGPVALGGLRRIAPNMKRVFRLPLASVIAPLAFIIISFLLYWARWPLTGQMSLLLLISLAIYLYYQQKQGWPLFKQQLRGAAWLVVYFIGMIIISWQGSKDFGGLGHLSIVTSHIVVAVFALLIYWWAINSAWHTPALEKVLKEKEEEGL